MASSTPQLLHGFIDSTHTSNVASFYPPQNLPTPWPLVAASILLSLTLSCYGIKGALWSWTEGGQDRRHILASQTRQTWLQTFRERRANYRAGVRNLVRGQTRTHPVVHESELEDLHRPDVAHARYGLNEASLMSYGQENGADGRHEMRLSEGDDVADKKEAEKDDTLKNSLGLGNDGVAYEDKPFDDDKSSKRSIVDPFGDSEAATLHESMREVPKSPKWDEAPLKRGILIFICAYSTFRAITAIALTMTGLINHQTPASAPSLLLLLLISIQIPLSNRSLPRLFTLIYTAAAVLTALAFLITASSTLASSTSIPKYGYLSLSGGNCPVPASDCHSQVTHWSVLGCANYTYYIDQEDGGGADIPETQFYPPYATSGDINLNSNALRIAETVIFVAGGLWIFSVLLNLYEARHLFVRPAILSNLARPQGPYANQQQRQWRAADRHYGAAFTSVVAVLGVMGAVVAGIVSLAAHISQATGTPAHAVTYIDSLGPGTWANFTRDPKHGYVTGSDYWGNATDWNDCFTVVAPTLGTGWAEWASQSGVWEWVRVVVVL